jgi:hypothetical protein
MTYHLHGTPGLIVFLAILGGATILTGAQNWLAERITIDLRPLWHVIPRRFKIRMRWDRPGALVDTDDGRLGAILYVLEHDDAPCPVALVQLYGDGDEAGFPHSEWFITASLSPAPSKSFSETWAAMSGKENESA